MTPFVRRVNSMLSSVRASWNQRRNVSKRRSRPAASTRTRLSLEPLEDRTTPTVMFEPGLGAEQVNSPPSGSFHTLSNVPVYLIFWGSQWGSPYAHGQPGTIPVRPILDDTQTMLSSPYLSGLTQYGSDGHAHLAGWKIDSSAIPAAFTQSDLQGRVQAAIQNGSLPNDPSGIYMVITPPGIHEGDVPSGELGYNSSYPVEVSDPGLIPLPGLGKDITYHYEYGWISTDGKPDHTTTILSHELVEAISDPYNSGVSVTLPPKVLSDFPNYDTGRQQICDGEPEADANNLYTYRVNGILVQAYWSQRDGAFIVPDGNSQTLRVASDYDSIGTRTQSVLYVVGDQLGANYNDTATLGIAPSGGVQVVLNGQTFQFESKAIFGTPDLLGDGIVVFLQGGSNALFVTGNPTDVPVGIYANGSHDYVQVGGGAVGAAGTLANINAPIFVDGSAGGVTVLDVNDKADSAAQDVSLNQGTISFSGLPFFSTIRVGQNIYNLEIDGGLGGNVFTMQNELQPYYNTDLYTGSGNNRVNVDGTAGPVDIHGEGGNDQVYVGEGSFTAGDPGFSPIQYRVTAVNYTGSTRLYINDRQDTTPRNMTIANRLISGLDSDASFLAWTGVTQVTISGSNQNNSYVINNPGPFVTDLYTGSGNDTVQVLGNTNTVIVYGQGGLNTVYVGSSGAANMGGTLANVLGQVYVSNTSNGLTDLYVDDSGDKASHTVTLSGGLLTGLGPSTISAGNGVTQLNIYAGSGINSFDLENPGSFPVYLNTGTRGGPVIVGSTTNPVTIDGAGVGGSITVGKGLLSAIHGAVTLENLGAGSYLGISNSADTASHPHVTLGPGSLTGLGGAAITWNLPASGELDLYDGSGLDSYTINNPGPFPTYIFTNNSKDPVNLLSNTGLVWFNYQTLAQAVAQFSITAPSGPVVAGKPFQVTVTALDANGQRVSTYGGTVSFAASYNQSLTLLSRQDGGAIFPADYTFTAKDAGKHTFTVVLTRNNTEGTEFLTVASTDGLASEVVNINVTLVVPTITLNDPSGAVSSGFGGAVAVSGSKMLIGESGAAFLYNTTGKLLHSFQDPNGSASDGFGFSVALSGKFILVGAFGINGESGAAYLYNTSGKLEHIFLDPKGTTGDAFGYSVALSGNNVLIGAQGVNNVSGAAYLYSASGKLLQTFGDPNGARDDSFGNSVALSGNKVLIGAQGVNGGAGAAYLYSTAGKLLQTFGDPNGVAGDQFGTAVALSGNKALVGAQGVNGGVGAAYLYNTSGKLRQTYQDPDGAAGDNFGNSVALSGSKVLIGASGAETYAGAAYLYNTSGHLLRGIPDPGAAAYDTFAFAVALSGNNVVIGTNAVNNGAGAAYLYKV